MKTAELAVLDVASNAVVIRSSHWRFMAAFIALVVFTLGGLSGCNKVDRENYDKVHPGMTMNEVQEILGKPSGSITNNVATATATELLWKWGDKSIGVWFVDGKAVKKEIDGREGHMEEHEGSLPGWNGPPEQN